MLKNIFILFVLIIFNGCVNKGVNPCKYEYKQCLKDCQKLDVDCKRECKSEYGACEMIKILK